MEKTFGRLIELLEWWAVFLLVLMVLLVFLGVFFRYVLGSALAWYDEFASYLLVWLTFYGAVVASYRGRHIGFETFVAGLRPSAKRRVELSRNSSSWDSKLCSSTTAGFSCKRWVTRLRFRWCG